MRGELIMKYVEVYPNCHPNLREMDISTNNSIGNKSQPSEALFRTTINAGSKINLMNLVEVSTPDNINVDFSLPFITENPTIKEYVDLFKSAKFLGKLLE